MKKNGFDYFQFFSDMTKHSVKAAALLHDILANFDHNSFSERMSEMHRIENAADSTKHEMMGHLVKEFLPPIEREDIVELAQELDSVVDAIDDIVRRIYMLDVKKLRPDALLFCDLITKACTALDTAMTEFTRFKKSNSLKEHLIEVNTFEMQGDALHAECMRRLYMENEDAKTTFIWTDIFDRLEDCLDTCEDAADIVESVVMKNS